MKGLEGGIPLGVVIRQNATLFLKPAFALLTCLLFVSPAFARHARPTRRSPPKEEDDMRAAEVLQGLKDVVGGQ